MFGILMYQAYIHIHTAPGGHNMPDYRDVCIYIYMGKL